MKVYFVNLGCVKNLVDTEGVASLLLKEGFFLSPSPLLADAIVINTCAFIKEAVDEAFSTINEFEGKDVVVIGCLVQRYKKKLIERFPWVKGFASVGQYENVPKILKKGKSFIRKRALPCFLKRELLFTLPHLAYIKVADGCSNHCSYCLIPSLRGEYKSRKMEEIVEEARWCAEKGVKEIIIVAQDTANYGKDLYGEFMLHKLLHELEKIPGLQWIRILYMHPAHINEELLRKIEESEKIIPYFDIPLQHIDDKMLSLMRRKVDKKYIMKLLERIKRIPYAKCRTTFLLGHPGEGEREFEHLYRFVKEEFFDYIGTFCYSKEEGTASAKLKEEVPRKVASQRQDALMKLAASISFKKLKEYEGKLLEAVVEGESGGKLICRPSFFAPSVDGILYAKGEAELGEFVKVRIKKATSYDLYGEIVKD